MAPITSKRSREAPSQEARKRQRINVRRSESKAASQFTSVALDSLLWKQAPQSDLTEDAEGFFGLEEIDDVHVVRDTKSGKVDFRVGKTLYEF